MSGTGTSGQFSWGWREDKHCWCTRWTRQVRPGSAGNRDGSHGRWKRYI